MDQDKRAETMEPISNEEATQAEGGLNCFYFHGIQKVLICKRCNQRFKVSSRVKKCPDCGGQVVVQNANFH